ncbi:DUF1330 domain-containing protein [Emcibacter sp.]|uniref:DUF1330 domain-containing protein n=1 Tax=Emcibacter sp. TaxID=1979954 RepID=UPI003A90F331
MSAYIIGSLIVKDWDWYREYRNVTEPLVAKHGGRYLVKGGNPETVEGSAPQAHAVVMIEFPDRQSAMNWYNDPEYVLMIDLRQKSNVLTELMLVDSVE